MVLAKKKVQSAKQQIKQGKIGKLEAKRKKIEQLRGLKKADRNSRKVEKAKEDPNKDDVVDKEGFFVLPKDFELDDRDEEILKQFSSFAPLGDDGINDISEMIKELDSQIELRTEEVKKEEMLADPARNEKIKVVYTDVGTFLSKYRSGKLPKPLKVLPMIANTFRILEITKPMNWTSHALYAVTESFSNSMPVDQFRIFLNKYVLTAVIRCLETHKKLDYHLYMSLKRGLYKPAAWFRGILFPLATRVGITNKLAQVIASAMSSKSIPGMHSSIALLKMTQSPYTGANNIFLLALLGKNYSLPKSVLSSVYRWIMAFKELKIKLPVLWFKTVLSFVTNYHMHFSEEQKDSLKHLLKKIHKHYLMSKEIIRIMSNRGESLNVTMIDDSMMVRD